MDSRSLPSAAPSADRISDRLLDGSAETSRSVSPCSRVSWRRAEESTSWPDSSATTSPGCTSLGVTSAMSRPCRSTAMRSASRNIWLMSWQASTTVVPCSRTRAIRSSTSADSCTPSAAVGSSSSSSRGCCAMARATATSWRWPPDSERTERPGSRSGTPSRLNSRAASLRIRTSENTWRRCSRPSRTFEATSRLSHSARSCQTTSMPRRLALIGSGGTGRPSSATTPDVGHDVPGDAADQGALARAVLARQGDQLTGPDGQVHAVQGGQRPEPRPQPGDRQLGRGRPPRRSWRQQSCVTFWTEGPLRTNWAPGNALAGGVPGARPAAAPAAAAG